MENINKKENLDKGMIIKLLLCAGMSAFWVFFMWGFWYKGVYALGINFFIFLALFLILFVWEIRKKERLLKQDLVWIIPFVLIALSFLIYDNPFLKVISILVFSFVFPLFYIYAFLDDKKKRHWDAHFFFKVARRFFNFFNKFGETITSYIEMIIPADKARKKIIAKIIAGVILFIAIALGVFIPLLSSADPIFGEKAKAMYDWLMNYFSVPVIYKIINFLAFAVLIASILFAWAKRLDYEEQEEKNEKVDSIVSGIVIGGISLLYLSFILLQLGRLWTGSLPFNFQETVDMVKSGFWQLFFLSIINTIIYFFTYRKTNRVVQWILSGFTIASLLLLSSAAYRMVLYVKYYGLSYEKFFASYTVVYCAILFIWLIIRLFKKKRANIIKFLVVLFLWMYCVLVVLPVEQIILHTNVKLSNLADSRIRLFELSMLSSDVLSSVKSYEARGMLNKSFIDTYYDNNGVLTEKRIDYANWGPWIDRQEKRVKNKRWYERNILNILYKDSYY